MHIINSLCALLVFVALVTLLVRHMKATEKKNEKTSERYKFLLTNTKRRNTGSGRNGRSLKVPRKG
jgi:hypothetical protein